MKSNFFSTELKNVRAHNGQGAIRFSRIFDNESFQTNCHFVDYAIIPPGASIGIHRHDHSEEIYIVMSGSAQMTLNNTLIDVHPGDIIVNPVGGVHGLVNDGEIEVQIVVVEIGATKLFEDHP